MDFLELVKKTETRTVEFDGFTVNLEVFKHKMTPAWRAEQKQAEGESDVATDMFRAAAHVIAKWDITKDGEEFPPTVENIRQLPDDLALAVTRKALGWKEPEAVDEVPEPNPTTSDAV